MITSIIEGIITKLKASGLDVEEFAYKDLIDKTHNLRRPAINIIVNRSSVRKITTSFNYPKFKHELVVSLLLVVHFVGSTVEKDGIRKNKIYDLIEAIHPLLTNEDFDLGLENPLFPLGWRNITTFELAEAQRQLYQIDFSCSFVIEPTDKDTYIGELNNILTKYWVVPGHDMETDPEDASDNLELT